MNNTIKDRTENKSELIIYDEDALAEAAVVIVETIMDDSGSAGSIDLSAIIDIAGGSLDDYVRLDTTTGNLMIDQSGTAQFDAETQTILTLDLSGVTMIVDVLVENGGTLQTCEIII